MNIKSENNERLIEKILKRLRPIAATRNIELVYESFRPVTAEVDEMKISLAISNLVENAIKYNKENGWVHVSLNADHKNCYIEVADSGIGIPAEAQEHILRDSTGWTSPIQEKLAEQDLVWQSQEVQWLCTEGRSKYSVSHRKELLLR